MLNHGDHQVLLSVKVLRLRLQHLPGRLCP
jgi:hypothetical protein